MSELGKAFKKHLNEFTRLNRSMTHLNEYTIVCFIQIHFFSITTHRLFHFSGVAHPPLVFTPEQHSRLLKKTGDDSLLQQITQNRLQSMLFVFSMVRKSYRTAETVAKSFIAEKYLKKIGLGKEDYYFWKQIGKALVCTYTVFGAMWLFNETSPLGWWTLKPVPKEEKELAHLYQRINYPYPGDEEAMTEFIAKGGMIGTMVSAKGTIEMDSGPANYQKQLQKEKFDQEALKLWLRMKNEVVQELHEKGYGIE